MNDRPAGPLAAPLPPADHAGRRGRLAGELHRAGVTAMVVTSAANVRYLTGFSGTNGQLLLDADRAVLLTDARYEERAAVEAPGVEVVLDRDWVGRATAFTRDHGHQRLGFEGDHVSYRMGTELAGRLGDERLGVISVHGLVESLREVKDDHELAALTIACQLTDRAFHAILGGLRPGRTELELATELERALVDLGAEAPAFPSIVASGPNSAVPHHAPTDRRLGAGEPLKLDFGARYAGYHADMTRTVFLGTPDPELREVHGHVREAQQRGVAAAVDGATGHEVDAACRDHLDEVGYGERFVHGTGHGVGLAIHEPPAVARGSSATLRAGTTVTIEPGVYLPGRGGVRIEDTVVVRGDGPPERLTTSPRDLLSL